MRVLATCEMPKNVVKNAAEKIVQAREERAQEHESVAATKTSSVKTSTSKKLYVETSPCGNVESPSLKAMLGSFKKGDVKRSTEKNWMVKEQFKKLSRDIHNEASNKAMDFDSVVERLENVVDGFVKILENEKLHRSLD